MAGKDYSGKDLDENSLIFRQIDKIGSLMAGDLEGVDIENVQKQVTMLNSSVSILEGMVSPLIDDEYEDRKEELIEKENEGEISSAEYAEKLFAAIVKLLNRNSRYFQRTAEFIIGDNLDEDEKKIMVKK